jgi:hypothetical protein
MESVPVEGDHTMSPLCWSGAANEAPGCDKDEVFLSQLATKKITKTMPKANDKLNMCFFDSCILFFPYKP